MEKRGMDKGKKQEIHWQRKNEIHKQKQGKGGMNKATDEKQHKL